ncbi:hypothetical protein JTB14_016904 [Gonioctena quinquepunctata]|nr:hypothetical protein JTB14_016904 [Gonioctena quinquepunctata]
MDPYEREITRLQNLYDNVPSDEGLIYDTDDDSIAEGEDEVSDHETDSEQDVPESEDEELNLTHYMADDYIIMEKTERNGKNLLLLEMSGLGVKILFHICQLPFVSIVKRVVHYTNMYITRVSLNYKDKNDAKPTSVAELKAFIGLLYLAGLDHGLDHGHNDPNQNHSKQRRLFIKTSGLELIKDHMESRAIMSGLHFYIRNAIAKHTGIDTEEKPDPPPNKRGHCKYCKKKKTRYFYKCCKAWLCMSHIISSCRVCVQQRS